MADFGNENLAELFRRPGSVTTVYADVTQDTSNPRRTSSLRARTVREMLDEAGAPQVDATAVHAALEQPPGLGGPISRLIVVRGGVVEVNEVLTGPPLAELKVSYGPVPEIIPLLTHRPRDLSYLVAEVGRDGADIRLCRLSRVQPVTELQVEGETEFITKVGSEDAFLSNGRYQSHTEEIWKRNEGKVAEILDEIVRENTVELLVVTGDVRARQLLVDQLSPASRAVLAVVPATTRTPDDTAHDLDEDLHRNIWAIIAQDELDALERLEAEFGRSSGLAELDESGVIHALQQGQVDVLLLAPASLEGQELSVLDREPWLAATAEDALGAGDLGIVSAADALTRAAILMDARVVIVSPSELPEHCSVAALLRYPTLPPKPSDYLT
jgi:hypothetical protein